MVSSVPLDTTEQKVGGKIKDKLGIDYYLHKPIENMEDFIKKVKELLGLD